jgi:hypothetical protein
MAFDPTKPFRCGRVENLVAGVEATGYELLLKVRYREHYLALGESLPTSNFDEANRPTYPSQFIFRQRKAH